MAKIGNKRIHAVGSNKELPEWVVERMTNGTILKDGSFDLETTNGKVRVTKEMIVAETDKGHIYACTPQQMNAMLVSLEDKPALAPVAPKAAPAPAAPAAPSEAAPSAPAAARKANRPLMALGAMPNLSWTQVDKLTVDDTYQRSIEGTASQKLILKIAMEWDWRLCVPLLVVQRREGLFVIDGQHRLEGARLRAQLGANDVPQLPCAIYAFDSVTEEADLFVQANRSRRPMGRLDVFHAQLAADDPKATALNDLVVAAGLVVGRNEAWQMIQPGEVTFTTTIGKQIKSVGAETAGKVLKMIAEAFEGEPLTSGSAMFTAVCDLYRTRKNTDPVKDDVLAKVLSSRTMKEWKELASEAVGAGAATGGFGRAEMMGTVMVQAYDEAKGA